MQTLSLQMQPYWIPLGVRFVMSVPGWELHHVVPMPYRWGLIGFTTALEAALLASLAEE